MPDAALPETVLQEKSAVRELCNRLRRVEGQARGVVRMIEEGRSCADIAVQMAALKAAVNRAAMAFVASYLQQCLAEAKEEDAADALSRVAQMFMRLA
ncbi:MAG: metal-sensitive transcriptional regulator [Bacillota bacterium]|nr:metal-sensitive transcriptional regulator [Bacillota bacterium]